MPKRKNGPKRRGPPASSGGEIPSAEQLMDRLGLNDNPPPLPNSGNSTATPQQISGPPPMDRRNGVPTAEELMNRMDEMKQPRRKKKRKKKQKKTGLKLPSAYDFSYKREKVST